ncbi:MAG: hypothetical protein U1E45_22835 [Geminicoccaceae bacterium]
MGAIGSLATIGLNMALARKAQRSDDSNLKDERDLKVRDILARDAEARRQQEQTLRRRLAEERARAGASGVGGTGGSADAVLKGLVEESRAESAASATATANDLEAINRAFENRRKQNLLDYNARWLNVGRSLSAKGLRSLLD